MSLICACFALVCTTDYMNCYRWVSHMYKQNPLLNQHHSPICSRSLKKCIQTVNCMRCLHKVEISYRAIQLGWFSVFWQLACKCWRDEEIASLIHYEGGIYHPPLHLPHRQTVQPEYSQERKDLISHWFSIFFCAK